MKLSNDVSEALRHIKEKDSGFYYNRSKLTNTIPYEELQKYQEYMIFRRIQRIRASMFLLDLIIFWMVMCFANLEFKSSNRITAYAILSLMSLDSLYSMYLAFIKIPTRTEGIIQDCRVNEKLRRRHKRVYVTEYGISNNGGMIYGENVGSYIGKHYKNYKKLNVGDEVICFSFGMGDNYLIKKEPIGNNNE